MERHRVEELFPPTYAYSIDELMKTIATDTDPSEAGSKSRSKGGVNQSARELYERVRVSFNRDIEERRQKSVQVGSPVSSRDCSLNDIVYVGSPKKSNEKSVVGRKKTQSSSTECIWSPRELEMLRDEHQKVKTDLANIVIQLQLVEKEKCKVETKLKEQEVKLRKLVKSLHHSQQECKRLTIRCGHLDKELRHSNAQVKMLEEDISDLIQEKRTFKQALRDMQKELIQERRTRTDIELRLQEDSHKLKLEHIATEDGLKLDYQIQINRLYEELKETQEMLEKEQKEHSINKKALNHLRTHFASLPVGDKEESLGDRLTKLQM